jgi:hypothetical protein
MLGDTIETVKNGGTWLVGYFDWKKPVFFGE